MSYLEGSYDTLMLNAIEHYIKFGAVTKNLVNTFRWIREGLYSVDPNPRYSSLLIYVEVNVPVLEPHVEFIWENFFNFQKYEPEAEN
jgi:hypothetical protein